MNQQEEMLKKILNKYKDKLFKELKSDTKRLNHSISVMEMVDSLLDLYNIKTNKKDILIASLFHDVCKNYTKKDYLNLIGEDSYLKYEKSPLLHGFAGSVYLSKYLGINDENILRAIRYHTNGHKDFEIVEKIIFISDKTDKTRTYKDVEIIRKTVIDLKELDRGIIIFLIELEKLLKNKNEVMHIAGKEFLDCLIKKERFSAKSKYNL